MEAQKNVRHPLESGQLAGTAQAERLWGTAKPFAVLYGGRGGGKSYMLADWSIAHAVEAPTRFLAARQYLNAIHDSIHELLQERIAALGVADQFRVTDDRIVHQNGSTWIYRGLQRNTGSLQSLQGIDAVMIEEGQYVTERGWKVLLPTIRKPQSRFLVALNPRFDTDPVYRDLVASEAYAPFTERIPINWRDNPFRSPQQEQKRLAAKLGDRVQYEHIWEGALLTRSEAAIYTRWKILENPPDIPPDAPMRYGLDIGFSNTPTAAIGAVMWDRPQRRVHVFAERYGLGATYEDLPRWLDAVYRGGRRRAIADHQVLPTGYIRRSSDWEIVLARKGPGSLDEGVRWLQGALITVDPECTEFAREIATYCYAVDEDEDVILPRIAKGQSDHALDALRYAGEPAMLPPRHAPSEEMPGGIYAG